MKKGMALKASTRKHKIRSVRRHTVMFVYECVHFMIYSSTSKYNTFNNEFREDRIKDKGKSKPEETRERKKDRGGRLRISGP